MRWWPVKIQRTQTEWAPPTALDSPAVLRELEHFRLWHLARIRRQRGGEFLGRSRGESNEFREYRPYVPGDDFRLIDWNLYIRLDRVFVKTFLDEEYRYVHILLDNSRSMLTGDRNKFAIARDLALSLSYLALCNDDRVVLGLLSDRKIKGSRRGEARGLSTALRGPTSLSRLRAFLGRIRPEGVFHPDVALRMHLAGQGRRRGLAVIISDFLVPPEALAAGIKNLVQHRYAVAALQVRDPRDEIFPAEGSLVRAIDQETGECRLVTIDPQNRRRYREAVERHAREVDFVCARFGVPITRFSTDENAEQFLLQVLPRTGLLRARGRG